MQRIYDFSVPGGKIRVIRQILITKQHYLAVDRAYRYTHHINGSEKFNDDENRAYRFEEEWEKETPGLHADATPQEVEQFTLRHKQDQAILTRQKTHGMLTRQGK